MRIFRRRNVWWIDLTLGTLPDGRQNRIRESLKVQGRKDVALIKAQEFLQNLEAHAVVKDVPLA